MPKPKNHPLDRLAPRKRAAYRDIPIPLDGNDGRDYDAARMRVDAANKAVNAAVGQAAKAAARRELADAEAALEEAFDRVSEGGLLICRVRSTSRKIWEDLVSDHPPTAAQRAEAEAAGVPSPWNPDTFPAALLARTVRLVDRDADGEEVEYELTVEQAQELWDADYMNPAECANLFGEAVQVNQTFRVVDLKKGSSGTRR